MGKISIPTPIGSIDFAWDKIIKDPKTDKKLILNIVKSFIIGVECEEDINSSEIDELLKNIKAFGHLTKFKDEDLEDYKKLVKKSNELKKSKKEKRKQILYDLIQEIENTEYEDKTFIIEKTKRTIAGIFGKIF